MIAARHVAKKYGAKTKLSSASFLLLQRHWCRGLIGATDNAFAWSYLLCDSSSIRTSVFNKSDLNDSEGSTRRGGAFSLESLFGATSRCLGNFANYLGISRHSRTVAKLSNDICKTFFFSFSQFWGWVLKQIWTQRVIVIHNRHIPNALVGNSSLKTIYTKNKMKEVFVHLKEGIFFFITWSSSL